MCTRTRIKVRVCIEHRVVGSTAQSAIVRLQATLCAQGFLAVGTYISHYAHHEAMHASRPSGDWATPPTLELACDGPLPSA